jgi:hypothetical protein
MMNGCPHNQFKAARPLANEVKGEEMQRASENFTHETS